MHELVKAVVESVQVTLDADGDIVFTVCPAPGVKVSYVTTRVNDESAVSIVATVGTRVDYVSKAIDLGDWDRNVFTTCARAARELEIKDPT